MGNVARLNRIRCVDQARATCCCTLGKSRAVRLSASTSRRSCISRRQTGAFPPATAWSLPQPEPSTLGFRFRLHQVLEVSAAALGEVMRGLCTFFGARFVTRSSVTPRTIQLFGDTRCLTLLGTVLVDGVFWTARYSMTPSLRFL